ncbi:MAG: hypothetical protein SF051_07730 [Elusimicrobiota bacterium]|nr:hypothetical protein [Elusimicrobiota bacterium]
MELTLRPRRVWLTLCGVALTLGALSASTWYLRERLGIRLLGLGRLLGVGLEQSLPTWYSVLLLAAAALTTAAVAAGEAKTRDGLAWKALAAGFALLSLDEQVGMHESAGKALRILNELDGFFYFGWVIPGGAVALLCLFAFSGLLRRLPARRRNQLLLADALYVGGAVGMEMVGAKAFSLTDDRTAPLYTLCYHLEELFEMLGVSLYLAALVEHLAERRDDAVLTLRAKL